MRFYLFSSVSVLSVLAVIGFFGCIALAIVTGVRRHNARVSEYGPSTSELKARLAELAAEIQALEQSDSLSRPHHIRAAQIAYDNLLAEACKRAGIPAFVDADANCIPTAAQRQWAEAHSLDIVPETAPRPSANRSYTDTERMERELSLAELGWVW